MFSFVALVALLSIFSILSKLRKIMSDQATLAADITAVHSQLVLAQVQLVAKLAALQDAVTAAGATTPAVDAAMSDLKQSAQAIAALAAAQ